MEAKRKSERNSNIEVLRLVAMGLIVLNHLQWGEMHYIDTNWSYIHRMGISQIVTFLSNWGGRLLILRDQCMVPVYRTTEY